MGSLSHFIVTALFWCRLVIGLESPNLHVYGEVPGLDPSPYYSFKIRERGSEDWIDTFAMLTECTAEKFCNTTGMFGHLEGWSNSYINFEMKDGTEIEIKIYKLFDGDIEKAVVHPVKAAKECTVSNGHAIVRITKPGLFTVDINGQMDDQDTGRTPEGPLYEGPPIHTLTIFANPKLEGKPLPDDIGVLTVAPGEEVPSEGDWDTLYFLPGTHDIGLNFTIHAGWDSTLFLLVISLCSENWFGNTKFLSCHFG